MVHWSRPLLPLVLAGAASLVPAASPALAQTASRPVVQPLPDPAVDALRSALRRLSSDPRSLDALLDAADASLALGQVDAAEGFYVRAQARAPDDGRLLTGLARIALARRDATEALRLFDRAAVMGEPLARFAPERGLAFDLVGLNARAQELYGEALARDADAETVRRLALSYAIAGDQDASEATLLPLLQAQDLAAYRTRAFALAIGGRAEEAVSIAETMLPARIAQRLAPYLRYMPQLTRAQQAAAANFGSFPVPAEIGVDAPATAALASAALPAAAPPRGADRRLIPGGAPLGADRARPAPSSGATAAAATGPALAQGSSGGPRPAVSGVPATGSGAFDAAPGTSGGPRPALSNSAGGSATMPNVLPTQTASAQGERRPSAVRWPPSETGEPALVVPSSTSELPPIAQAPSQEQPAFVDGPAATPPIPDANPAPPDRVDLARAFADFDLPSARPAGPSSPDAVDIARITPPRDAPLERDPPARKLPLNPSRHWVQVATGQDVANFRYDWRRISGQASDLLADYAAYYAAWGANNRLVTGPFPSASEAQAMVSRLSAGGVPSFVFTSIGGERVLPLP